MKLQINESTSKQEKPLFDENLGFGKYFTDHMFMMEYNNGEWQNAKICPLDHFSMHPASMVLHYGQGIFEGMKAYRSNDDLFLFRPEENLKRMNQSANKLVMPEFDEAFVLNAIKKLVMLEKDWIPTNMGYSMYIRPSMIATESFLGVRPANHYLFFVILSPVGAYYSSGFNPVEIFVSENHVRAVRGGVGNAKAIGNYAASLRGMQEGVQHNCNQVLWLDALERKYIEEVGSMNIFVRLGDKLLTPPLSGAILPGITRDSIITITNEWGLNVEERPISIDEVIKNINSDIEIFGTGTAAIISPVGKLVYQNKRHLVGNGQVGDLTQKLFNYLTNLQTGKIPDNFNFTHKIT